MDSKLKKLATTSENALLNNRASVPRLSLCILIDETILSIFEMLCVDLRSVIKVLQVCKSFRRIAWYFIHIVGRMST